MWGFAPFGPKFGASQMTLQQHENRAMLNREKSYSFSVRGTSPSTTKGTARATPHPTALHRTDATAAILPRRARQRRGPLRYLPARTAAREWLLRDKLSCAIDRQLLVAWLNRSTVESERERFDG
jgi:hypothetical protein